MQLQHNGKTFEWIGEAWGDRSLHSCEMRVESDGLVYFVGIGWKAFYETHHMVDQLVTLGYMKVVGEDIQTDSPIQGIEKVEEFDANFYSPKVTTDTDYLSYPQSPGEKNLWKQVALLSTTLNLVIDKLNSK